MVWFSSYDLTSSAYANVLVAGLYRHTDINLTQHLFGGGAMVTA